MILGLLALAWPGETLAARVLLSGVYARVDRVLARLATSGTGQAHRSAMLLEGLLLVLAFRLRGVGRLHHAPAAA